MGIEQRLQPMAETNAVSAHQRSSFYQEHLNRVSRSFALGIEKLVLPLRVPVGLSYLICRLLDTVEDAPWSTFADQERAFRAFDSFLEIEPSREDVEIWSGAFPERIPDAERLLLADAWQIFRDYHRGSSAEREAIRGPVLSMSAGMLHYMRRKGEHGILKLGRLAEVNRYCFFVAGVVGEVLTGLVRAKAPELGLEAESSDRLSDVDACRFGLFLQKVNILKDQRGDEPEGRHLVPSRDEVLRSLELDAEGALRYLTSIPVALSSYRLFCAWALYLGLASLPYIEKSFREQSSAKIPRLSAMMLLGKVERSLSDDEALEALFGELAGRVFEPLEKSASAGGAGSVRSEIDDDAEVERLIGLYRGRMERADLVRLFS